MRHSSWAKDDMFVEVIQTGHRSRLTTGDTVRFAVLEDGTVIGRSKNLSVHRLPVRHGRKQRVQVEQISR